MDRILKYARQNRQKLIKVADLEQPLSDRKFAAAAGFLRWRNGSIELLMPSGAFRSAFPDARQLIAALQKTGDGVTEGGSQPKATIKTPRRICSSGRVYCFRSARLRTLMSNPKH